MNCESSQALQVLLGTGLLLVKGWPLASSVAGWLGVYLPRQVVLHQRFSLSLFRALPHIVAGAGQGLIRPLRAL